VSNPQIEKSLKRKRDNEFRAVQGEKAGGKGRRRKEDIVDFRNPLLL
jgi:hypothetical protein